MIYLMKALMYICEKTGRVLKITGTAGPDDVYLIRYYIIRNKYFNVFIHQFLRSDRDDLHDHPWNFATYLVRGAYTEQKYNPDTKSVENMYRINVNLGYRELKENTLVFRKATDLHRVVVEKELKYSERDDAALTFFVSGPFKRDWGFVKDGKWVDWRVYLGLPPNTPSRG